MSDLWSPLGKLENAMGIEPSPMSDRFDGAIDFEDDDSPPVGRSAVNYGGDDLFDSPVAGMADLDDEMQVVPGGGGQATLITHLESMAAEIEAASGEPETAIRGQIAHLRSVLAAQPAVIAQQVARLNSTLPAHSASDGISTEVAEVAAQAILDESVNSIEDNINRVDLLLRNDPDAVQMLSRSAHVWAPTLAPDRTG